MNQTIREYKKRCFGCMVVKNSSAFYANRKTKDKLSTKCKHCVKIVSYVWYRSKEGIISATFCNQKTKSKERGHNPPKYTKKELGVWMLDQPNFQELYDKWVDSGYKKDNKPSVDRINDYKGYSFDNIRLVSFRENYMKAIHHSIMGVSTTGDAMCKRVNQYTKNGIFIATFHSASEAERQTCAWSTHIRSCCNGKLKTAGGFVWSYKKDES